MAYKAYEQSAGVSVIKSVEEHCKHLTDSGTFSATGTPVLARVEQWNDEAYYRLQGELAKEGYGITVAAAQSAVIGILERLNVYGAVMQIELAHPITGRGGEPNDRYETYRQLWDEGVTILASDALSVLGHPRTTELSAYTEVGGISKGRKRVLYEDTDAVQSRYKRGFGKSPLVSEPTAPDQGSAV